MISKIMNVILFILLVTLAVIVYRQMNIIAAMADLIEYQDFEIESMKNFIRNVGR